MLFETLDKIRSKPKQVRDQYALGIAVACTVILVGVWSLSLPSKFSSLSGTVGNHATGSAPFSGLINQVKDGFGSVKNSVASVINSATSTITGVDVSATPTSTPTTSIATKNTRLSHPVSILVSTTTSSRSSSTTQNYIQIGTSTRN